MAQQETKEHRQLRNAESGRNSLSRGRAHRLVIQCPWSALKDRRASHTALTGQVVFSYLGMHTHACMTTVKEKEAVSLKESEEGVHGRVCGGENGRDTV